MRYPLGANETPGYTSAAWRRVRAFVLARDPYCLLRIKCEGARSTVADHIVLRRQKGSDDPANLQGACQPCHNSVTARYDGGWGQEVRGGKPGRGPEESLASSSLVGELRLITARAQ